MTDSTFGGSFILGANGEPIAEDEPVTPGVTPDGLEATSVAAASASEEVAGVVPMAPSPQGFPSPAASPASTWSQPTRKERLAIALDDLMRDSSEIDGTSLVSLDGFTMASVLPEGMHEDRVGAMSAAILGLGERAAAELGKGQVSQVFVEGEGGYVLLVAAGGRAVLTCLAGPDAKLGLVLYDMRTAALRIAEILG